MLYNLIMNTSHYLLRDSNEIFGIYNTLDIAYNHLLQFMYNFNRYYKLTNPSKDMEYNLRLLVKNFQIIHYDNNMVINLYNVDNTFKLVDTHSNNINISTVSISDFISKLENICEEINIDSNDLKLFIPVNFTETEVVKKQNQSINDNSKNISTNDINKELKELKEKIELLDELKENEKNSLNKIKNELKTKEEQVFMEKIKNERLREKFEQKKEYYEKMKNKFKIDKELYYRIKSEIKNGSRQSSNLPELFIDEYKIFLKLEEDNLLDMELSENLFQEYLKYKPEKKQNFNTLYDNIFNSNINESSDEESSDEESDNDSNKEIKKINDKKLLFTGEL
jgi:hypothetical protein